MLYIDNPADVFRIEREMGLPELIGSPKQVKWARKIRVNILVPLKYLSEHGEPVYAEVFKKYLEETQARFWIDDRDRQSRYLSSANIVYFMQAFPEKHVYTPKTMVKDGIVDIIHLDGGVYYKYKRDRDFKRIVENCCRYVGGAWYGYETSLGRVPRDLLMSGFTINCDTELVIDTTIDIPEDLLDED